MEICAISGRLVRIRSEKFEGVSRLLVEKLFATHWHRVWKLYGAAGDPPMASSRQKEIAADLSELLWNSNDSKKMSNRICASFGPRRSGSIKVIGIQKWERSNGEFNAKFEIRAKLETGLLKWGESFLGRIHWGALICGELGRTALKANAFDGRASETKFSQLFRSNDAFQSGSSRVRMPA